MKLLIKSPENGVNLTLKKSLRILFFEPEVYAEHCWKAGAYSEMEVVI